jgi:hypothetical protein
VQTRDIPYSDGCTSRDFNEPDSRHFWWKITRRTAACFAKRSVRRRAHTSSSHTWIRRQALSRLAIDEFDW